MSIESFASMMPMAETRFESSRCLRSDLAALVLDVLEAVGLLGQDPVEQRLGAEPAGER